MLARCAVCGRVAAWVSMASRQETDADGPMDAPGEESQLPETAAAQGDSLEAATATEGTTAGIPPRTLKLRKTRTPPNVRKRSGPGGEQPPDQPVSGDEQHDGDTD